MARLHADKMKFYADNEDCKVYYKYGDAWYTHNEANNPIWHKYVSYVITNNNIEEGLFWAWADKKKLERKNGSEWVEETGIPEFHKYEYRLKKEKSPYELAIEEANEQKASDEPVDIYKWHYGTGIGFCNSTSWEFYMRKVLCKTATGLCYEKGQLYKKRKTE